MKKISAALLLGLVTLSAIAQNTNINNTLLWKISGNGIEKPSYLFGTIHMICKEDAVISNNLRSAIEKADRVYLEVDMDNLMEMLGLMTKMKMKGDTTLADLLTPEQYEEVKAFFESRSAMLPFSLLETFKPFVASSMIMERGTECEESVAMEQVIMGEAKKNNKRIEGLETMAYQASVFDSIPYKVQARELYKMISAGDDGADSKEEFEELSKAYKEQDLEKLGRLISESSDEMMQYQEVLLYNRNRNWVAKLKDLLPNKSLVIAVGAGHLPGENGVIDLLRKEGYKVEPVENKVAKEKVI